MGFKQKASVCAFVSAAPQYLGLVSRKHKKGLGGAAKRMGAESDVEATPRRPELGEACPLSEAHRRRLYADEYAFLEKELFASLIRRNILVRLIGRESSMHLGGSSEQKELDFHPRSYFCPYYWTKRARQLTRASEEEGPKLRNLLNRRSRLLEKLEDERLCILDRADGSKDQYECVPASAEAWFRAGCVHGPSEQNIGRRLGVPDGGARVQRQPLVCVVRRARHLARPLARSMASHNVCSACAPASTTQYTGLCSLTRIE